MSGSNRSKNHHWWPVGLQNYWTDNNGDVSWIDPDGKIDKKRADNRKIGYKIHGHTMLRGGVWETNFEDEFDIDNEVHNIVEGLKRLRPLGPSFRDISRLFGLVFKRDRKLKDLCNFYHIDEKLHRDFLLFLYAILIRSPRARNKFEAYPSMLGLPANEEVGKINMASNYKAFKERNKKAALSNYYFIIIHSPFNKFIFGDGCLDWFTETSMTGIADSRALVPITPNICVYICSPRFIRNKLNCASFNAPFWMVDWINDITQIYSRDKLFFLGKPPSLKEPFLKKQFLEHKERGDALLDMLDEIAGAARSTSLLTLSAARW